MIQGLFGGDKRQTEDGGDCEARSESPPIIPLINQPIHFPWIRVKAYIYSSLVEKYLFKPDLLPLQAINLLKKEPQALRSFKTRFIAPTGNKSSKKEPQALRSFTIKKGLSMMLAPLRLSPSLPIQL